MVSPIYLPDQPFISEQERAKRRVLKDMFDGCREINPFKIKDAISRGADPNTYDPTNLRMAWAHLFSNGCPSKDEDLSTCLSILLDNGMQPLKHSGGQKSILLAISHDYLSCGIILVSKVGKKAILEHQDAKRYNSFDWWQNIEMLWSEKCALALQESTVPVQQVATRRRSL